MLKLGAINQRGPIGRETKVKQNGHFSVVCSLLTHPRMLASMWRLAGKTRGCWPLRDFRESRDERQKRPTCQPVHMLEVNRYVTCLYGHTNTAHKRGVGGWYREFGAMRCTVILRQHPHHCGIRHPSSRH